MPKTYQHYLPLFFSSVELTLLYFMEGWKSSRNSVKNSVVCEKPNHTLKAPLNLIREAFCLNINLAPSYCHRQLPANYRRHSSVSQLSSGWGQSGSTAP